MISAPLSTARQGRDCSAHSGFCNPTKFEFSAQAKGILNRMPFGVREAHELFRRALVLAVLMLMTFMVVHSFALLLLHHLRKLLLLVVIENRIDFGMGCVHGCFHLLVLLLR